jgi:hypothetical protein
MLLFVLPPQQVQRQIEFLVDFELLVDVVAVRQRFGRGLDRKRRGKVSALALTALLRNQWLVWCGKRIGASIGDQMTKSVKEVKL